MGIINKIAIDFNKFANGHLPATPPPKPHLKTNAYYQRNAPLF